MFEQESSQVKSSALDSVRIASTACGRSRVNILRVKAEAIR